MNREEDLRPDPDELEENMVVADMAGLAPRRPLVVPVFDAGKQMDAQQEQMRSGRTAADVDADGIKAAMKGALGASLLIWLVYALAFGAFIFLLTRLFDFKGF